MADITQSNWAEADDDNNQPASDGAPEGMPLAGLNNTLRMVMGAIKRWFGWSIPKITTGTGTAYILSYPVPAAALIDGEARLVQFHTANGAPATLNGNSRGAKPLHYYANGAWGAIPANLLTAGMVGHVSYNQADGAYRIISTSRSWLDILTTRGDLLTRDASGYVRLPLGAAGKALVSNGTDIVWGGFDTGDVKIAYRSTEPAGSLFMNGKTIGNASSGATVRANADTEERFTHLWNEDATNTLLVIQTGAGAPTTRGLNAVADFAANKRMPLPDPEGCTFAVADNMGGGATARLGSGATGGFGGTVTLGKIGGEKSHQLTVAEMPAHRHSQVPGANGLGSSGDPAASAGGSLILGAPTDWTGGDGTHNNVQPTFVIHASIKL
ncbi:hypothetical protein [Reyranella sp.]|uniref:hypothetical protein n=1 Tax=Reyranella sp. TaxID=1929291 RepID=UPI00121D7FD3|nr:hypothetical protein [Reyranella sp.]TAJ91006.1 MAG: hypothetical protein EPO50_00305 [Reyranella sp.]